MRDLDKEIIVDAIVGLGETGGYDLPVLLMRDKFILGRSNGWNESFFWNREKLLTLEKEFLLKIYQDLKSIDHNWNEDHEKWEKTQIQNKRIVRSIGENFIARGLLPLGGKAWDEEAARKKEHETQQAAKRDEKRARMHAH